MTEGANGTVTEGSVFHVLIVVYLYPRNPESVNPIQNGQGVIG